jgi:D-xylose transport system ATP-binding protein
VIQPTFELRNITKTFPGTIAVDDVSMEGRPGEIIALVGENGAGKSTLMRILAGVYPHGSFGGEVFLDGMDRRLTSVADAEEIGIVFVPQEITLVPAMSVAENIFLNHEPTRHGFVDFGAMHQRSRQLLDSMGVAVDPRTPVGSLGIAHQQAVELARASSKDARVLILDEPTSSLTSREASILFGHLREWRSRGLCAIYISHRIDEVMEIADRVVVLRDGRVAGEGSTRTMAPGDIVRLMVGREFSEMFPRESRRAGGTVLQIDGWGVEDPNVPGRWKVHNVSLEVRAGEVLGIFGAIGSGRSELMLSLFGAYSSPGVGTLKIDGNPVSVTSPHDALAAGMALLTEDRLALGIEPWMSLQANLTLSVLPQLSRFGLISAADEQNLAVQQVAALRIVARSPKASIMELSGGNQQKAILGRALLTKPRVLLLDEPTRGIDIGAKADIFSLLNDAAESGMAIVFVSSEAPEMLQVTDRIAVLREGRVVGIHNSDAADEETLVTEATGASR